MSANKPKRTSGPSGPAKPYHQRVKDFGGRLDAWLPDSVWDQLEKLAAVDGSRTKAVSIAISERFSRVFGGSKKK